MQLLEMKALGEMREWAKGGELVRYVLSQVVNSAINFLHPNSCGRVKNLAMEI